MNQWVVWIYLSFVYRSYIYIYIHLSCVYIHMRICRACIYICVFVVRIYIYVFVVRVYANAWKWTTARHRDKYLHNLQFFHRRGFELTWTATDESPTSLTTVAPITDQMIPCGGNISQNGDTPIYFESPNHPADYPKNVACTWYITTENAEGMMVCTMGEIGQHFWTKHKIQFNFRSLPRTISRHSSRSSLRICQVLVVGDKFSSVAHRNFVPPPLMIIVLHVSLCSVYNLRWHCRSAGFIYRGYRPGGTSLHWAFCGKNLLRGSL